MPRPVVSSEDPIPQGTPRGRAERLAVECLYRAIDAILFARETAPAGARWLGAVAAWARPRPRFTVKWLMACVAASAVACGAGVSILRHREAAALAWREADLLGWAASYEAQAREIRELDRGDPAPAARPRLVDDLEAAADDARRRAVRVRRRGLRCERAARRPWLAVRPDPPGPE